MVIRRGEIWWADIPEPDGSEPGYTRPVMVIQSDSFNRSAIQTVLVACITKNIALQAAPGNVFLPSAISKLPVNSVVNISQILTLDRRFLRDRISRLEKSLISNINCGLKLIFDL